MSLSLLSAKQAKIIAQSGPHSIGKLQELTLEICNDLPSKITGSVGRVTVFGAVENAGDKGSYVALVPDERTTDALADEAALIANRLGRPLIKRINPHLGILYKITDTEYAFKLADQLDALLAQPEVPRELILGKAKPVSVEL